MRWWCFVKFSYGDVYFFCGVAVFKVPPPPSSPLHLVQIDIWSNYCISIWCLHLKHVIIVSSILNNFLFGFFSWSYHWEKGILSGTSFNTTVHGYLIQNNNTRTLSPYENKLSIHKFLTPCNTTVFVCKQIEADIIPRVMAHSRGIPCKNCFRCRELVNPTSQKKKDFVQLVNTPPVRQTG